MNKGWRSVFRRLHAESSCFASQHNVTTLPGYVTFDLGAWDRFVRLGGQAAPK